MMNLNTNIQAVTLCDPPGHGASSLSCGERAYFEPVVFAPPDSWVDQFGTGNFTINIKTGKVYDKTDEFIY